VATPVATPVTITHTALKADVWHTPVAAPELGAPVATPANVAALTMPLGMHAGRECELGGCAEERACSHCDPQVELWPDPAGEIPPARSIHPCVPTETST
jgi:hypothetical protein